MTTAAGSKTPDSKTPDDSKAPDSDGTPAKTPAVGRTVLWTGLVLGTAVTVLAVMHGIRVPGLEVVLSVLATWVLLVILAVTAAELLRRHHRALARHAARHGKRGALFAARHGRRGALAAGRGARRGSRSALGYLAQKAAARWQNREHRPLMFTRHSGPAPQTPAGTAGPASTAATAPAPPPPSGTARGAGSPHLKGKPPWQTRSSTTTPPGPGSGPAAGSRRRTAPGTPRPGPAGPCRPNGPG